MDLMAFYVQLWVREGTLMKFRAGSHSIRLITFIFYVFTTSFSIIIFFHQKRQIGFSRSRTVTPKTNRRNLIKTTKTSTETCHSSSDDEKVLRSYSSEWCRRTEWMFETSFLRSCHSIICSIYRRAFLSIFLSLSLAIKESRKCFFIKLNRLSLTFHYLTFSRKWILSWRSQIKYDGIHSLKV